MGVIVHHISMNLTLQRTGVYLVGLTQETDAQKTWAMWKEGITTMLRVSALVVGLRCLSWPCACCIPQRTWNRPLTIVA